MTQLQIDARMEAYEQVIASLDGKWTDDKTEAGQGEILQKQLRKQADRWYQRTMRRKDKEN